MPGFSKKNHRSLNISGSFFQLPIFIWFPLNEGTQKLNLHWNNKSHVLNNGSKVAECINMSFDWIFLSGSPNRGRKNNNLQPESRESHGKVSGFDCSYSFSSERRRQIVYYWRWGRGVGHRAEKDFTFSSPEYPKTKGHHHVIIFPRFSADNSDNVSRMWDQSQLPFKSAFLRLTCYTTMESRWFRSLYAFAGMFQNRWHLL